ncbi:SCO4848 family membrane protein [Arthrobacter gengyunqii]|uniref:SCO4848 family membrane protein n=1 Tax=Arthrobacter gengyunqii TaxID=2886940 RepID=UPI00311AB5F3
MDNGIVLPTALAVILIIAGLWSLIVWPPYLIEAYKSPKARDEKGAPTRYLTVNLMKVSTSMVFGLVTIIVGFRALMG